MAHHAFQTSACPKQTIRAFYDLSMLANNMHRPPAFLLFLLIFASRNLEAQSTPFPRVPLDSLVHSQFIVLDSTQDWYPIEIGRARGERVTLDRFERGANHKIYYELSAPDGWSWKDSNVVGSIPWLMRAADIDSARNRFLNHTVFLRSPYRPYVNIGTKATIKSRRYINRSTPLRIVEIGLGHSSVYPIRVFVKLPSGVLGFRDVRVSNTNILRGYPLDVDPLGSAWSESGSFNAVFADSAGVDIPLDSVRKSLARAFLRLGWGDSSQRFTKRLPHATGARIGSTDPPEVSFGKGKLGPLTFDSGTAFFIDGLLTVVRFDVSTLISDSTAMRRLLLKLSENLGPITKAGSPPESGSCLALAIHAILPRYAQLETESIGLGWALARADKSPIDIFLHQNWDSNSGTKCKVFLEVADPSYGRE